MADDFKKNDALAVVGAAGAITAQSGPIIGAIVGSLFVADACLFGGFVTMILAVCLQDDDDDK